jgi:sugar phosphate isomerase/epimerase
MAATATRSFTDFAGRVPFRLGVVNNEISQDIARAAEVAAAIGASDLELHSLGGKSVVDLSDDEARRARDAVEARGLRVGQITGPAFKSATLDEVAPEGAPETEVYRRHRDSLERAMALAHLMGTDRVRLFAFERPKAGITAGTPGWHPSPAPAPAELETIARGLRPLCRQAEGAGITLLVENVRYSYADTGRHTAAVLAAAGAPNLRLIWDPANAYVSGEERPYPEGYEATRDAVARVHAKDARFADRASGATAWERIGAGGVDWVGQLRALIAGGFDGVVSLETHWKLPGASGGDAGERSTLATWEGLAVALDQALGDG